MRSRTMIALDPRRRPFFLPFVIGVWVGTVQPAQAALVQVTFSGTVDEYGSGAESQVPGINIGDPVSGTFIYDSSIADGNSSAQIGYFPDAIISFDASIGSKSYSLVDSRDSDRSEIAIVDDQTIFVTEYQDQIKFVGALFEEGDSIEHYLSLYFTTTTGAPSTWIDDSSVLPLPTDIDLNAADTTRGSIRLDPFDNTGAPYFTISTSTISYATIPATPDDVALSTHGSACQPANLGQAINFQASWSQLGVRNINSEGSGRSFFVVCPVSFGDNFEKDPQLLGDDILLNLTTGSISTNVDVTCTGFWYGPTSVLNTVTQTFTLGPNGTGDFDLPNIVDPNITKPNGYTQSVAVVCALPPQTGVRRLTFNWN